MGSPVTFKTGSFIFLPRLYDGVKKHQLGLVFFNRLFYEDL